MWILFTDMCQYLQLVYMHTEQLALHALKTDTVRYIWLPAPCSCCFYNYLTCLLFLLICNILLYENEWRKSMIHLFIIRYLVCMICNVAKYILMYVSMGQMCSFLWGRIRVRITLWWFLKDGTTRGVGGRYEKDCTQFFMLFCNFKISSR